MNFAHMLTFTAIQFVWPISLLFSCPPLNLHFLQTNKINVLCDYVTELRPLSRATSGDAFCLTTSKDIRDLQQVAQYWGMDIEGRLDNGLCSYEFSGEQSYFRINLERSGDIPKGSESHHSLNQGCPSSKKLKGSKCVELAKCPILNCNTAEDLEIDEKCKISTTKELQRFFMMYPIGPGANLCASTTPLFKNVASYLSIKGLQLESDNSVCSDEWCCYPHQGEQVSFFVSFSRPMAL